MNSNGVEIRWDNTLRYSIGFRLGSPDPSLLADRNADDGDRNFRSGLMTNRVDLLSEFDISKGSLGFDVSAAGWFDQVYNRRNDNDSPYTANTVSVPNNEFTHATRNLEGRDAEILNAFVHDTVDIAGMPLSFRIGRHTLLWGESLFFAGNGIAAGQAPVDDIKALSVPTAEAKEVFMPVAQVSASLQPFPGVAIDAYYQFEWRKDRLPGAGSYFSNNDFLDSGGESLILDPSDRLLRTKDQTPPLATGDFGIAFHYNSDELELGLYALRFNSREPQLKFLPYSAVPGAANTYDLVYAHDIEIYGASFSGYLGDANIAGEISGRRNMPLASAAVNVGANVDVGGYWHPVGAVGDTLHAQVSTVTTLPRSRFWDGADLSAEIAANRRLDITADAAALNPSRTRSAASFRGVIAPQYFEILPNLDLSFPIGLGYGLIGRSSVDDTQNAHAGDVEFGVSATYHAVWEGTLMLTHYLGRSSIQPLADRDFVILSVQRTF